VEVEWLRWWDDRQRGDLIHFFGTAGNSYLQQARCVKLPVVMTALFTETCNRSDAQLLRQAWLIRLVLALPFGEGVKQQLTWRAYGNCARAVVGLEAERQVLERVYGVPPERISVVPLGLSETYLRAGAGSRSEPHLICTGTITARKNCLELAEMAIAVQTPILFVGKPYHPTDPYWLRFEKLIDNRWVKYHAHVASELEMIALLQSARGFVLMSNYENWCLSAHEAAACGLPLLVQDQKWSRERFGEEARYFENIGNTTKNAALLRQFYDAAPALPSPKIKIPSWLDAASTLKIAYERALSISR
jgi:glycosyltransferase involved in cell wall biosynthesis